jgi:hypothetical protein
MLTIQKVRVKSSSHFSRCGQPQGNILMLAGGQLQVARRGHCSLYLPGYLSYSSQFIFSLVSIIDGYSQYPPGYLSYSSQFIFSLVSICLLVTLSTCLGTCLTYHCLYYVMIIPSYALIGKYQCMFGYLSHLSLFNPNPYCLGI